MNKFAIGIVLLIVLHSSASCQPATRRSSAENSIREAVIRYQMEGWIQGSKLSAKEAKTPDERTTAKETDFKIFFVSTNGRDPGDAFLKRLRDIPRTIKKESRSQTIGPRFIVVDKSTGQRGIIFHADEIRWRSDNIVEVEGGYVCDGLCAESKTFRLRQTDGKWKVTGTIVHRIS